MTLRPFHDDDPRMLSREALEAEVVDLRARLGPCGEGEARQRAILESVTSFAIIVTDRDGRVTDWNVGAERILGWAAGDMVGIGIKRIFTPEDRDRDRAGTEMRLSLEGGRAVNERWHMRQDGTRFWASGEMMPLMSRQGDHIGFVKVLRDRTAEHRAGKALRENEARLRESEDHFRNTVDLNPQVPWTADPQGNITSYSNRWLELTGQIPGEPLGAGWAKVIHPDDVSATMVAFGASLASGDSVDVDYRIHVKDAGDYRWMRSRAYPRRDEGGAIIRWYGVVEDIHDRKLAEAALRESEEQFRVFSQAMPHHVWAGTPEGRLYWFNERVYAYSGVRHGELDGTTWTSIVHPDDLPDAARDWTASLTTGFVYETEFRIRRTDGAYRWFLVRAEPVRAADGSILRWVGTNTDIDDRRRQAAELKLLNETLEERISTRTRELMVAEESLRQSQKMEAVGQLTGGIAHDFNNLLTGISGSLELLQTRVSQGRLTEIDRYVNAAQGASKRAAALTHRLLAFSRRQTLDPKPTDVNRLVAGMEELIRRTIGPGITLEVVGASGLWSVLVDPGQLENALLNLCINARDAMPDGGRITIETANRWLDPCGSRERDMEAGQHLSLCVTDTGSGMTPEVIARAFEPFFTTKPIGQGTGLGLSMIYGFVRQSGGQVRIYSEIGDGTTMCLYLPRHYGPADVVEGMPDLSTAPRATQGQTVLVVDDEPTVRLLVTEVLQDLGYTAIEAADGAAGLKVLRSDVRIDLLVTDVGLPGGMNGRQMADVGRVARPGLKVLFITGYAENAVVGNGHLEPGMHVLTKPFVMESLATRIRDLIAST